MKFSKTTHIALALSWLCICIMQVRCLAQSPCAPPVNLQVLSVTQTTATLRWTSPNAPLSDHCWTLEVGAQGFTCGQGQQVVELTICQGGPGVMVNGDKVTYTVSGLQAGASYDWTLVETCDGIFPPNNFSGPCSNAVGPTFTTYDSPFLVNGDSQEPTCPEISPGYNPNGSITIEIIDPLTCPGTTYEISISPVPNSSPLGNTPPPVIPNGDAGPAGIYSFINAGAGQYSVQVTETGPCNPQENPKEIIVSVPDGTDTEGPLWYITDVLGNIIVDNDPLTNPAPDVDLGTINIPEGACGYQQQLFAYGYDNCDGVILNPEAVDAAAVTFPGSVDPPTQVTVTPGSEQQEIAFYLIDIQWSVGNTTITATMQDAAGNAPALSLTANVTDNVNPSVTITGAANTTIPACTDSREIIVTVQVEDGCDQFFTIDSLIVNFNGTEQLNASGVNYAEYIVTVTTADNGAVWSAQYTDYFGNEAFADVAITVVQAAEDLDPVIDVPGNLSYQIPACDDTAPVLLSLQVQDDCEDIDPAALLFDDGGSGIGGNVSVDNDPANNTALFEFSGDVAPGIYQMSAIYGPTSLAWEMTISQDIPQAAQIILPGNLNFTIPVCEEQLNTTFGVQILDDCDALIEGALFTLAGQPLTPSFSNPAEGYFEFTESLTSADNGALLAVSYTNGAGLVAVLDALITVTEQADNWAPVIVYPSNDINVTLDVCESGPALVYFEATATDNCDGELTPEVSASPAAGITILTFSSEGGATYLALADPGTYQILVTAEDAAGNTRQEDFVINVSQDPAPQPDLSCNDTINVVLNASCQALVVPDMVLEGEFGCLEDDDFIISIQDDNPANGDLLDGCGVFAYEISLAEPAPVIGFNGDFAPASWSIDIQGGGFVEFAANGSSLTLNSGSQFNFFDPSFAGAAITLPAGGNLSFDWAFDGNDPGFDFFGYLIDDNGNIVSDFSTSQPGNGSVAETVSAGFVLAIFIQSPFDQFIASQAVVTNFLFEPAFGADPGDFETCWGYIQAEDKTDPVIECPDDTDQATTERQVQFIEGSLSSSDPKLFPADHSCFLDFVNPSPGPHPYDLFTFTVSAADVYTFDMASSWGGGLGALYQGAFDPDNPCSNIIAQGDFVFDGTLVDFFPFDPILRIALPLQPGQTYTLLTSANGNVGNGLTGDYTWGVYSDGGSQLSGLPLSSQTVVRDLICEDLDEIRLDNLPADVPRCYEVDGAGNIILPPNTAQQQLLQQLLDRLAYTGYPYNGPQNMGGSVADNCGNIEICVTDDLITNGDCGPAVLTRTFTATDEKGNTNDCFQLINIRKPALADVMAPPFTATLECDEAFPLDANGNPHPSATGYPFIHTSFGITDLDEDYCNIGAVYEDGAAIDVCESGYKVVRTWTLIDWCDPASTVNYTQIIKVGDFTPPEVSCAFSDQDGDGQPDPLVFSTGPFDCSASFAVPVPQVTDNCSSWEVLTEIVTVFGGDTIVLAIIPPGAPNNFVSSIPPGCHWIRYTVTDDCDNASVVYCEFCVVDEVEPVAQCKEELTLSLGGDGLGRAYSEDIDNGSWDNCDEISLEVRRLVEQDPQTCDPVTPFFTDWGPYIDFTCCDVDQLITVELRVTDASGNINICWMEVLVEDKVRPMCVAPEDATVTCEDLPYEFEPTELEQLQELFGEPEANDNCAADWEELEPIVSLHDCGYGTIIRRFRAIDQAGNISINPCQQLVVIEPSFNYEIRFPADTSGNCGQFDADTIQFQELGCDLLAVSVEDEAFSASGDECFKLFRTYRVINWCEYDGESDPIVISREEDCDGVPGDEAVWVLRRPDIAYVDRDNDENNAIPLAGEKGTACDGTTNPEGYWRTTTSIGYWQYTQVIKVYDDIPPTIDFSVPDPFCSLDVTDCDAPVDYLFLVTENCTPDDLIIEVFYDENADGVIDDDITEEGLSGQYPKFKVTGEYPLGSHQFEVRIEDGCGNAIVAFLPFEVVDCKAPSPVCINGLVVELMPVPPGTDADGDGDIDTGAFMLEATGFIASPNLDCLPPVTYSINILGELPDPDQDVLVVTCDDLGTLIVEIYAWDSAFNPYSIQPDGILGGPNYDHCETFVLVADNISDVCETGEIVVISGFIATEEDEGVEEVAVQLSGQMSEVQLTDNNGMYTFSEVLAGYDYTLTPELDANHANGVSTFDLVLITKHILGVQLLDSPYKMIAADVNRSGSISTIDMIQIRKLILNITTEFESNTSWRFVPVAYQFPDPANPWMEVFPEVINFNDLMENVTDADFVAIKIGDINLNASTNGLQEVEDRSSGEAFRLMTPRLNLEAGSEYTVWFDAPELSQVQGFQFTLEFDPTALELLDLREGIARKANFGTRLLNGGVLTSSWNATVAAAPLDEPLFGLVFRSLADARLDELLQISSRYTRAEAYDLTDAVMNVALQFIDTAIDRPAVVSVRNWPNPFREKTYLGFHIPEEGAVVTRIISANGRLLKTIHRDYPAGYQQLLIDGNGLPESGVLYYEISGPGWLRTGKLVRVE